ncbi:MAG: cupin domain-containing protein [Pseudohongiellaceae bacterium]
MKIVYSDYMSVLKLTALAVMTMLLMGVNANAAESASSAPRQLPAMLENQEMLILTINLEPGQASQPHRHNAYVYVTVLEGNIEMQVRGGPLTLLGPGEMFFETPADIHEVSRNASSTRSAKFVVHMLKTVGEPVTVPVQ